MLNQKVTQQKIECENITRVDGDRVFCYRLQEWINSESCTCSAETRKEIVSQEW